MKSIPQFLVLHTTLFGGRFFSRCGGRGATALPERGSKLQRPRNGRDARCPSAARPETVPTREGRVAPMSSKSPFPSRITATALPFRLRQVRPREGARDVHEAAREDARPPGGGGGRGATALPQ